VGEVAPARIVPRHGHQVTDRGLPQGFEVHEIEP
jgi:hypothetical protein